MDQITKILMAMGLSEGIIPQEVIDYYLAEWTSVYPDNECLALHNTISSLYEWLIRSSANEGSGGGSTKEKVGNTEISYSDYNKGRDWEDAYNNYLNDPTSALPSCRGVLKSNGATIIINGTSKSKVKEINCNPDRFNVYDSKSPFTPRYRKYNEDD